MALDELVLKAVTIVTQLFLKEDKRRHAAEPPHQGRQHDKQVNCQPEQHRADKRRQGKEQVIAEDAVVEKIRQKTPTGATRIASRMMKSAIWFTPSSSSTIAAALPVSIRVRAIPVISGEDQGEHVLLDDRLKGIGRDNGDERVHSKRLFWPAASFSSLRLVFGQQVVPLLGRDDVAGPNRVDQGEADGGRPGGGDHHVGEHPQPDPANMRRPTQPRDANRQRTEHQRNDGHEDKVEEDGAEGLGDVRDGPFDAGARRASCSTPRFTRQPATAPATSPSRMRLCEIWWVWSAI